MRSEIQLALVTAALIAGPVYADDDPPDLHCDMARALRAEFHYSPPPPTAPAPAAPDKIPGNGDVIAMPKLTVLSSRINLRELERDIVRNRARAVAQEPKWGCGPLYHVDLGKIRFTVVSAFYIPFTVGISW